MSSVRKNTLVVDFSVLPVRPDVGKVHNFLENEIGLNIADVKCIQLHNTRNCVFIEMLDNDIAQRYARAHNIRRVFVCQNQRFKIPVYVDSEAVTVRVHDLPPSVPHAAVAEFMKQFGDVTSIQSERWKHYFPGVPNGVRVLQMRLKRPIPSYITLDNNVCLVVHPNQQKTCRWCLKPAHPNQKCVEPTVAKTATPSTAVATTASSSEKILSNADFPPMPCNKQSTQSSPNTLCDISSGSNQLLTDGHGKADDNNDNEDDKASTASNNSTATDSEFIEATNKRRLSKQKQNEKKKVCSGQCAQTIGHRDGNGSGKSDFL